MINQRASLPEPIGRFSKSKFAKYCVLLLAILACAEHRNIPLNAVLTTVGVGAWVSARRSTTSTEPYLFHASLFGEGGWRGKLIVTLFWLLVSMISAVCAHTFLQSKREASVALGVAILCVTLHNAHYKAVYLRAERGEGYLDD